MNLTNRKLADELNNANKERERIQSELTEWMTAAENNTKLVASLEQKTKFLTSEKRDFELMISK